MSPNLLQMLLPKEFNEGRKLQNLVENQTSYSLDHAEMHVFETHEIAQKVLLKFDQPVLASMLQGKKVMHLNEMSSFDFLPGESLILPSDELMCIDFPEAKMDDPTKCLAMTIDEAKIDEVIRVLNESTPKADAEWRYADYNFHFTNDYALHSLIQRLLFIFMEDHPSKDMFADYMLRELIVRILQTETREIYTENSLKLGNNNRIAYIIDYIRNHLDDKLKVSDLAEMACMSESNFHRVFKNEIGVSPLDFILEERIKLASSLLRDPNRKIKDVYLECGFNSCSYFNRIFKKKQNISPRAFKNIIDQHNPNSRIV